jgi:hypothetical protein
MGETGASANDQFEIVYNLRSMASGGAFPWGSSMQGVKAIGVPHTRGDGKVELWSVGGGFHFEIRRASGFRFAVECIFQDVPTNARFGWSLLQTGGLIRGELTQIDARKFAFDTPVSDHPSAFFLGLYQLSETALEGQTWSIRRLKFSATR